MQKPRLLVNLIEVNPFTHCAFFLHSISWSKTPYIYRYVLKNRVYIMEIPLPVSQTYLNNFVIPSARSHDYFCKKVVNWDTHVIASHTALSRKWLISNELILLMEFWWHFFSVLKPAISTCWFLRQLLMSGVWIKISRLSIRQEILFTTKGLHPFLTLNVQ